jgi:riboflavin kinase/FMN adenylyltransferase
VKVLEGSLAGWEAQTSPGAVTIGVFDGVHKGHRVLLDVLRAQGGSPTLLTFDPHPAEVLSPGTNPRLITTIEERIRLLQGLGVEVVGVLDLSEIRHYEPARFVAEVLVDKLAATSIVVGNDFHFGRDRAGDVDFLRAAGERHGFRVVAVDLHESGGVITSTRIRDLIESGEVTAASDLLGSRYRLSNVVDHGEKRGRALGFPTANLRPPERKVIPGNGIYAAFAELDGRAHPAAVNVGVRPTFGGGELLVEAYLLDFEADLYGRVLTLEFVDRLRPEVQFDDVGALVARMNDDVAGVRRILGQPATT